MSLLRRLIVQNLNYLFPYILDSMQGNKAWQLIAVADSLRTRIDTSVFI